MKLKGDHLSNFKIDIRKENFDINLETKLLIDRRVNVGAVVSFLGLVRDLSQSNDLQFMEIEHYPGMSEKVLRKLCKRASLRWDLKGISLIHRFGKLYPGDSIVLLIIASAHRSEAFDASEFIMDFLKSEAPFWKKETTSTGAIWIKENQVDKQKRLRW